MTFISYYMFYTLHVVEPLRYDSVLIKETNEWMNVMGQAQYIFGGVEDWDTNLKQKRRKMVQF